MVIAHRKQFVYREISTVDTGNYGNTQAQHDQSSAVMSHEQQGIPSAGVANITATPVTMSPGNIDGSIEQNAYVSFELSNDGAHESNAANH